MEFYNKTLNVLILFSRLFYIDILYNYMILTFHIDPFAAIHLMILIVVFQTFAPYFLEVRVFFNVKYGHSMFTLLYGGALVQAFMET